MNAIAECFRSTACDAGASIMRDALLDPLEADQPSDLPVVTTRRGLTRLALVAAETGGRFQRDGIGHDPMAWLLAPRRVFGGAAAVDAALGRDDCMRAVLLHGLGLELDADRADVDDLLDDADDVPTDGEGSEHDGGSEDGDGHVDAAAPRLFTSMLAAIAGNCTVMAFDAMVCSSDEQLRARIRARVGAELAERAEVREGFPASAPIVEALVSDAMADMLAQVEAAPTSPLAAGLDVVLQQRFLA